MTTESSSDSTASLFKQGSQDPGEEGVWLPNYLSGHLLRAPVRSLGFGQHVVLWRQESVSGPHPTMRQGPRECEAPQPRLHVTTCGQRLCFSVLLCCLWWKDIYLYKDKVWTKWGGVFKLLKYFGIFKPFRSTSYGVIPNSTPVCYPIGNIRLFIKIALFCL